MYFTGNYARIKGTTDLQIDSAGIPNPDWDCIVDDKVVERRKLFQTSRTDGHSAFLQIWAKEITLFA